MTPKELQQLVEEVSLEFFQKPFVHQATFNARLKTTGGRYHLKDHHLDFNPRMLVLEREEFIAIIKHELCHYHLHLEGKGYQHKDPEFKALLAQTGGSRFAPNLQKEVKLLVYQCQKCQRSVHRRRRINTQRYVCGYCQGRLQWKETKTVAVERRLREN